MISEHDPIGLCLAGHISPQVALARLLLGGAAPATLAATLAARRPGADGEAAWLALAGLLDGRRDMLAGLAGEIAAGYRDPQAQPTDHIAAFFDHAVAYSPEASVALFSLGDPAILAEATAEIMHWLQRHGWVTPGADVLDLGCGIGRLSLALAERCRSVVGVDVSAGMVAEARRRCADAANVRLQQTAGTDLDAWPDAAFDLVLAVDSFPYVLQAGPDIVTRHFSGAARILRPNRPLVILNLSYGRDLATDRADIAAWARLHGFAVTMAGELPFALWDGTAFVLRRLAEDGS